VTPRDSPLLPRAQQRHRVFRGLSEWQEQLFGWLAALVVLMFIAGWIGAIDNLRRIQRQLAAHQKATDIPIAPTAAVTPTRQIATSVLNQNTSATAFIDNAMLAFLAPLHGASGKVYFTARTPGSPIASGAPGTAKAVISESGHTIEMSPDFVAPSNPGMYKLAVQIGQATRSVDDLSVFTLVPFSEKRAGHIGLYYLGSWPFEGSRRLKTAAYANPEGFIEVTPQNADTHVSEHFRLRDFLTRDQPNVWPKYILLEPKLLDKLELTIQQLEATGHLVRNMHIMSGFRTPEYNHTGGNTQGRANLSRHMYGDASDVFVDNDGNGLMDDLNHDGRVDVHDAEVIQQAVESVEQQHPELAGGVGVYSACCGHGPFTHIDVRGYRARWRGFGNG
jgi:uncharacterized protein YcbK (DUF882 family)